MPEYKFKTEKEITNCFNCPCNSDKEDGYCELNDDVVCETDFIPDSCMLVIVEKHIKKTCTACEHVEEDLDDMNGVCGQCDIYRSNWKKRSEITN